MNKHFSLLAALAAAIAVAVTCSAQATEVELVPNNLNWAKHGEELYNVDDGDEITALESSADGTRKRKSVPSLGASISLDLGLTRDSIVWYQYGQGSENYREYIEAAMEQFENHTCIRFMKTGGLLSLGRRVVFTGTGRCSVDSSIGLLSSSLELSLGPTCHSVVSIMKLIGFSIGMYPEHTRADRDQHVVPIYRNIDMAYRVHFQRANPQTYGTPYDYLSITQLGPLSFTSNGHSTLNTLDAFAQGLTIINRTGFSFMDKRRLNSMFGCIDQWAKECDRTQTYCQHEGYVGSDCNCICPEGTRGSQCENQDSSYAQALINTHLPFNEYLNREGVVKSPYFPFPENEEVVCTKYIEAPKCNKVVATVETFELAGRCSNGLCCEEAVEIRRGDPVTSSEWSCGYQYAVNDTIVSEGNTLVLFYAKGKMENNTQAGFRFKYKFQPVPGCTL